MRRRIVQSTLAVAVVAVLLLGVPLAVAAVVVDLEDAERAAKAVAESVGQAVGEPVAAGQALSPSQLRAPQGYHVEVRLPDGSVVSSGERPRDPASVGRFQGGSYSVTAQRSRSAGVARMFRVVLVVLLVAVLAVVAAVTLGLRQARRLAEPLVDLAHHAQRLGSGEARPQFARYGLEEVDRVAEVLERSAERVADMLAIERQFASDASHQLRTPLTALSMRLEEILNTEDPGIVREEARIAIGQVERLAATVEHLLASSRQSRVATTERVRLDEVIDQQVDEWRPAFDAARRRVAVSGLRGLEACATPGGLAQVLATLLENSLAHGAGTVGVRTRLAGGSVVLEVRDEGPGVPAELGHRVFERSVSGARAPAWGWPWPATWPRPTGGASSWCRSAPRSSRCSWGRSRSPRRRPLCPGRPEAAGDRGQATGVRRRRPARGAPPRPRRAGRPIGGRTRSGTPCRSPCRRRWRRYCRPACP